MASTRKTNRVLLLCVAVAAVFMAGCRQDPTPDTRYYHRELAQMKRDELRADAEKAAKAASLKDGYPWRDSAAQNCLPCSIKVSDKKLAEEIKYLHETVHGKTKTRPRLRD